MVRNNPGRTPVKLLVSTVGILVLLMKVTPFGPTDVLCTARCRLLTLVPTLWEWVAKTCVFGAGEKLAFKVSEFSPSLRP